MARIAGVDLPNDKRIEIALTYIYGIGRTTSNKILADAGVDPDTRVRDITDDEVHLGIVQPMTHIILLLLITTENTNLTNVSAKKTVQHCITKTTCASSNQEDFVFKY